MIGLHVYKAASQTPILNGVYQQYLPVSLFEAPILKKLAFDVVVLSDYIM